MVVGTNFLIVNYQEPSHVTLQIEFTTKTWTNNTYIDRCNGWKRSTLCNMEIYPLIYIYLTTSSEERI